MPPIFKVVMIVKCSSFIASMWLHVSRDAAFAALQAELDNQPCQSHHLRIYLEPLLV